MFTTGAVNSLGNDDLLAAFSAGVLVSHYDVFFFCSFLRVGSAVSWDGYFNLQTKGDKFSPVLDLVLNCICFIYIGAWLPFDQFDISELGISPWRLVVLLLVIVALRRIPSLLILYKLLPEVSNWREALFCGHFGPVSHLRFLLNSILILCVQIGVGAVFISSLAQSRLEAPQNPPSSQQDILASSLQPIVSFIILGSILIRMSPRFRFRGRFPMFVLLDGLSIPLFSAGDRILSLKTDPPDLLKWVTRESSQEDTERAAASTNEIQREGQNQVEWLGLSTLPDPVSEDVKTSGKLEALKLRGVCTAVLPWPLTFLIRYD